MGAVSSVARLPMGRALSEIVPTMISEEAAAALDIAVPSTGPHANFSELNAEQIRFLNAVHVDLKPIYQRKNNIIVN